MCHSIAAVSLLVILSLPVYHNKIGTFQIWLHNSIVIGKCTLNINLRYINYLCVNDVMIVKELDQYNHICILYKLSNIYMQEVYNSIRYINVLIQAARPLPQKPEYTWIVIHTTCGQFLITYNCNINIEIN